MIKNERTAAINSQRKRWSAARVAMAMSMIGRYVNREAHDVQAERNKVPGSKEAGTPSGRDPARLLNRSTIDETSESVCHQRVELQQGERALSPARIGGKVSLGLAASVMGQQ
jgi:hypothetical protein